MWPQCIPTPPQAIVRERLIRSRIERLPKCPGKPCTSSSDTAGSRLHHLSSPPPCQSRPSQHRENRADTVPAVPTSTASTSRRSQGVQCILLVRVRVLRCAPPTHPHCPDGC